VIAAPAVFLESRQADRVFHTGSAHLINRGDVGLIDAIAGAVTIQSPVFALTLSAFAALDSRLFLITDGFADSFESRWVWISLGIEFVDPHIYPP
jgi:hypothetical protein